MGTMEGKIAIITGGGSGIGKAIAEIFCKEGCTVIITGRTKEKLDKVAEEMKGTSGTILPMTCDVTDSSQVAEVFHAVVKKYSKLDVLVNNASIFGGARFDEVTDDQWSRMMSTGLDGTFYCSREAFRFMKDNGGGRIINIGSVAAFRPRENATAYSVCKAAVSMLTNSIALDGREFGIAASCIHPGNTMVERRADGHPGTGKDEGVEEMISSDDIARTALLMATLPPNSNMLEAVVLPINMKFLGRG